MHSLFPRFLQRCLLSRLIDSIVSLHVFYALTYARFILNYPFMHKTMKKENMQQKTTNEIINEQKKKIFL